MRKINIYINKNANDDIKFIHELYRVGSFCGKCVGLTFPSLVSLTLHISHHTVYTLGILCSNHFYKSLFSNPVIRCMCFTVWGVFSHVFHRWSHSLHSLFFLYIAPIYFFNTLYIEFMKHILNTCVHAVTPYSCCDQKIDIQGALKGQHISTKKRSQKSYSLLIKTNHRPF